jgi:hypothetical protein
MSGVRFTERMHGYISFVEQDYNQGLLDGRRHGRRCSFQVAISVDELGALLAGAVGAGKLTGHIDCEELGGRLKVADGEFSLFADQADERMKRMRYRLWAKDAEGRKLTLSGFKDVTDSPNFDLWTDTTTLMVRLLGGHVTQQEEDAAEPEDMTAITIATGVMRISLLGFLRLLTTMRAYGGSAGERAGALVRFVGLFAGQLIKVYGGPPPADHLPDFPDPVLPGRERWQGYPEGVWHETPELPGLWRRIVPYTTDEDPAHQGTLHNVRKREDAGGVPVLLLHGTGVRANLFYGAPGRASIIPELLDKGFDVWLSNWRASIDLPPDDYTLDEAARYDHPAAIKRVLDETGHDSLRVLCHCQGSTSFMITYLADLPELQGRVTHVVSSAVSLHPLVPRLSRLKMNALIPVLGLATPYVSAQWGARRPTPFSVVVAELARWTHGRSHDPICALGNFMYGSGRDVLWRHANLDPETHHWTSREFGFAPFRFFGQMRKSVLAKHLVPSGDEVPNLPRSYIDAPLPANGPKWTFVAGDRNRLFVPESQRRSFAHFRDRQSGHSCEILDGFGHLDVLFGITAPAKAYPTMIAGLGPVPPPGSGGSRFRRRRGGQPRDQSGVS